MATIKSYTDIEQSRTLAEILPLESADNIYERVVIAGCNLDIPEEQQYIHKDISFILFKGVGIPCWSLAALLDVYPIAVGKDLDMFCCWENRKNLCSRHYDNPIDACYELIVKLHKLNLL